MSRPRLRATAFSIVVGCAGFWVGCTAINGLDSNYQELACFPSHSCTDGSVATNGADGSALGDGASTLGDAGTALGDGASTLDDAATASEADAACGAGTMSCGAGCVALDDVNYCGSCTNDCAKLPNVATSSVGCQAGQCTYQCSAGYADCSDSGAGCKTSLSTSATCGACGVACSGTNSLCAPAAGGGYACAQSCPAAAPTVCMGSCVDEQTSASACGGCGAAFACTAGDTCVGGQCVGPNLSISPTPYAFTATTVGQNATAMPFVVSNTGNGSSGVLSTALSGANATDFGITSDGCNGQTLAPGASCTIDVQFTPASRGSRAASLDINGGAVFAALTGTGQDSVTLTVTKSGAGTGSVSGGPISCGATCASSILRNSTTDPVVTLTAAAGASSTFAGWTGACSGTGATCAVTMSQAQTVNAEFDVTPVALTLNARSFGGASGTVSSNVSGLGCTAPCSQTVQVTPGAVVSLSTTGGGSAWWGPNCTGSSCVVNVANAAQTVNVTFSNNNYMFATSSTYNGNLGGLTGADGLCAAAAKNSGLPGTYVAWLATTTTTALSRLGSARGWLLTNGAPFADTIGVSGGKTGIRNGQIFSGPTFDEFGDNSSASQLATAWTGANEDGSLVSGNNCSDWTSSTSATNGLNGTQSYGSGQWTNQFVQNCASSSSIYCFGTDTSNALTIPAPTARIAFLSVGKFTPSSGLSAADSLCQSEASTAGFPSPSTYLAVLATPTASALSRFSLAGAAWQRPDGMSLATSAAAMANTLSNVPTERSDGSYPSTEVYVWTGSAPVTAAGTSASTCSNWSSNSSAISGATGNPASPYNWFNASTDPCSVALPVYCFEQ